MILITGGLGYVGSHLAIELLRNGYHVIALDNGTNVSCPVYPIVGGLPGTFEVLNRDCSWLRTTYMSNIEAVFHCAGSISVPESYERPLEYYENNVRETIDVLRFVANNKVPFLGFSSTAGIFAHEEDKQSPYATTKLACEKMIMQTAAAEKFDYGILRYFNVAGADHEGRAGENSIYVGHLIKRLAIAIADNEPTFTINGDSFETVDGTAIRDYVHPTDVARAHIGQMYLDATGSLYSIGSGSGYSVAYVVQAARRLFPEWTPTIEIAEPRPGDVARLVADPAAARYDLGWFPKYGLDDMIKTAVMFERRLREMYNN